MEEDEDAIFAVLWLGSGYEMFSRRGGDSISVLGAVVVPDVVGVGGRKLGTLRRAMRVIAGARVGAEAAIGAFWTAGRLIFWSFGVSSNGCSCDTKILAGAGSKERGLGCCVIVAWIANTLSTEPAISCFHLLHLRHIDRTFRNSILDTERTT